MKRFVFWALLSGFCFSLYAQAGNGVLIFTEVVLGNGPIPKDNSYYINLLNREVEARHHRLTRNHDTADFSLKALVGGPYAINDLPAPFASQSGAVHGPPEKAYLFYLILEGAKEHLYIMEQNLLFDTIETLEDFIPLLMENVFAVIPEGLPPPPIVQPPLPDEPDEPAVSWDNTPPEWRNRWLFLGFRALGEYTSIASDEFKASFGGGAGILLELNLLKFLSLESGADLVLNRIELISSHAYNAILLEVPVLLRFSINPSDSFVFGPFGGVKFNFSLPGLPISSSVKPPSPSLSWTAGFHYEVKVGPGTIFVSPSMTMDITDKPFEIDDGSAPDYKRKWILGLGVGYKIGFFNKN
ncbi:MAG: hypothetical protein LBH43_17860 [Treponema sp.]|jgi:hypothetical protein|nr:hypothetical protein [Treponema sp.]